MLLAKKKNFQSQIDMKHFESLWLFVKKYWQLFLLVIVTVFGILFFRNQRSSFVDELKKIQDIHNEELKKIQEARQQEKLQHAENEKRLHDAMSVVQVQYDLAKKQLDDKKKQQVEELVKTYGTNPNELAKQLSAVTGFTIVLPDGV